MTKTLLEVPNICAPRVKRYLLVIPGGLLLGGCTPGMTDDTGGPWTETWIGRNLDSAKSMWVVLF